MLRRHGIARRIGRTRLDRYSRLNRPRPRRSLAFQRPFLRPRLIFSRAAPNALSQASAIREARGYGFYSFDWLACSPLITGGRSVNQGVNLDLNGPCLKDNVGFAVGPLLIILYLFPGFFQIFLNVLYLGIEIDSFFKICNGCGVVLFLMIRAAAVIVSFGEINQ
jgi:hypothetical protein